MLEVFKKQMFTEAFQYHKLCDDEVIKEIGNKYKKLQINYFVPWQDIPSIWAWKVMLSKGSRVEINQTTDEGQAKVLEWNSWVSTKDQCPEEGQIRGMMQED